MRKNAKKKDHENLTAKNIEKVKALLNPGSASEKPITKKQACDILNIAYNTARLQKIIEDYDERKEYTKKRKAGLRGRPAMREEIAEACESYLMGDTISSISKSLFRSPSFVRAILERVGVPQRPSGKEERVGSHYYPDECLSDDYADGEIAWSATYHAAVVVKGRLTKEYIDARKGLAFVDYESKYGCPCYAIYVRQKVDSEDTYFSTVTEGGFSAYAPAYELCKLEHLREYGVKIERL